MRPTVARSNRSPVSQPRSSPIPSPSTTPSIYHQQQQQQQQILYAPINNSMVTLQPCGTALHPSCVYPSVQSHVVSPNSGPLYLQGKNNRWHTKNKPSRGQQYYQQQQQQQQQLSYNSKPVVLFDQSSSNITPIPPSTTSFLVASSTFTHAGPLPSEHYNNNSGVTHLLPQSLKPPSMQSFCLIQDRQNGQQQQQQQQQQHSMQASYYNISATNTCSLQTVNANSSFPLANLNPYANLASFPTSMQSSPLLSSPPVNLVLAPPRGDKPSPLPVLDFSPFKHNANKLTSVYESRVVPAIGQRSENVNGWPPQIETSKNSCDAQTTNDDKCLESADRALQKAIAKTDEEHYSDESSNSFDFTIEAEKMVSALCNTTSSNDLGKEESKPGNKTDSTPLFSGAGDNVSNKASWFADLCSEYESGTSIGVQTDGPCVIDRSQYPELIRKTAYWGCTEAEIVLGSDGSQTDSKRSWLACLSSATRTAITKSSTCIPVFAGDRIFANDLVNALLRISNGWLSLDNYLNKQHFPSLLDRLDPELIARFHTWEESTYELLRQIVRTFQKFGENNEAVSPKRNATCESSSFPGDVSLYTNYDLFIPLPSCSLSQRNAIGKSSQENSHGASSASQSTSSLRNLQYNPGQQEQQSANQKESKLRSKWTITENPSSVINATKSVPNVSVCRTNVGALTNSKLRTRDAFSSRKFDATQKSLNAEFYQLRNKVMVNGADAIKDRGHDCIPENKPSALLDNAESIRLRYPAMNTPSYSGLYAQNCLSFTFPLSGHSDTSYPACNPGILTYGVSSYPSSGSHPFTDINSRNGRHSEQIYRTKIANVNPIYVGRSQTDRIELPTVPRNKVTLLSQIEPRTLDKQSEEMAANLSAWFASMRNAQLPTASVPIREESRTNENSTPRLFAQQETPRYPISGVLKQSTQIDANRQFQALQNLPNIQSTPWAAGNFVDNRFQTRRAPEEYDSSEDVRVYMKPGSYNVPKKRHQRRPNRRSDNNVASRNASNHHNSACSNKGKSVSIPASSTPLSHANTSTLSTNVGNATLIKTSFPPASQLPTPLFNLESSSRILKRAESPSQNAHQDVTWKAACASAEILLEALNVKDCSNASKKVDPNDSTEKDDKIEENVEASPTTLRRSDPKPTKCDDVDCASSYEASEDDSGSTCRLSPSTSVVSVSQSREDGNALNIKTNVKTDFWLIRTLNNASVVGKQKRHKNDVDRRSSESSNSSEIADVKSDQLASSLIADADTKIADSEYPAIFSHERISDSFSRKDETSAKESEGRVGRATYSETVRRSVKSSNVYAERKEPYKSCVTNSSVIPILSRKCQRKDPEQSYQLLHRSRRTADRKAMRNADDLQLEEESRAKVRLNDVTSKSSTAAKTHRKTKALEHAEGKCAGKSGDRGWSVWYSSRRKQSLSPLALSKLETIYRTVWQMDEARIFKYPLSCDNKDGQSPSAETIEDYCKVVKSPMFLEIIEYKLKNRIYHKVEHAVKDFHRIIRNARLYHQHDDEQARKVEVLSRKLEDLLEEHFADWDFDNINTGSPREGSPVQPRFKASGQKLVAGARCDSAKKAVSSSTIAENSPLH